MVTSTSRSKQEIRNLLTIANYLSENSRVRGQTRDQIAIADTLRWVLGEEDVEIAGYFRGNIAAIYGNKIGTELIQEWAND